MLIAVSSFISVAVEIAQSVKYNFIIISVWVSVNTRLGIKRLFYVCLKKGFGVTFE